eukprot:EG_transcript_13435
MAPTSNPTGEPLLAPSVDDRRPRWGLVWAAVVLGVAGALLLAPAPAPAALHSSWSATATASHPALRPVQTLPPTAAVAPLVGGSVAPPQAAGWAAYGGEPRPHQPPGAPQQSGRALLGAVTTLAVACAVGLASLLGRHPPLPQAMAMATVAGNRISRREVPLNLEEPAVPSNTFTKDQPFVAVVESKRLLTGPKALGETYHIVLRTNGAIPCREGQCYGVIPPGTDVGPDGQPKAHYPRLYTIATSRYGDHCDGQTTSLCVKKIAWWDQQVGGLKKELCSHFLCDAEPGTEVTMIGPTANSMLLDPAPDAVHICVATGTGVAPYRAFWRRLFCERGPGEVFRGRLWLFFGGANPDELLYADELADLQATYPDQVQLVTAFSEVEQTASGEKMFVQDKLALHAEEVFRLLQSGAHLYCSGSKFMMPGIQSTL